MKVSLVLGGFSGLAMGAIIGWLAFDSVIGGIGIGISLTAGVCGVLVAYGYEQSE